MIACRLLVLLGAAAIHCACAVSVAHAADRTLNFRVDLDGTEIGNHRYTVRGPDNAREVTSQAQFAVKIAFVTAYRYSHESTERWRGNCLSSLHARTDDDGKKTLVDATATDDKLVIREGGKSTTLDGCVMTFAYWNPEMLRQSRLLNQQTGEVTAVKIAPLGDATIDVRGTQVMARHYRITGPKEPIDLWYSPSQEWLALESTVGNGRRLRYRLQ